MSRQKDWFAGWGGRAVLVTLGLGVGAPCRAAEPIAVSTVDELVAALVEENAGRHIVLAAGTYAVAGPLFVPDGVTLEGSGVMSGSKLPEGFAPGTETRISASFPFSGDVLTAGDGVRLAQLVVEHAAGALGSAIAVKSRDAGDSLSVTIDECEIVNPNPSGVSPGGPIGEGVLLVTLNPNFGLDPPPHNGSSIDLRMNRSIIHSRQGAAVFALNFSSSSTISATLSDNIIEGQLRVGGGVSRPDAVSDSSTVINSLQNVYRGDQQPGSLQTAWQIYGGSGVPIGLAGEETRRNSIQFSSQGDSIEGFRRAILAAAGVRLNTMPAPAFDNTVDLRLRQVSIATPNDAASTDLSLQGAYSTTGLPAGTGNVLRVQLSGATGSGYRNNVYAHATGPDTPDSGNALVILGSATAFGQANSDLLPTPATQFFIASD
jgi:hypothetical protein